MTPRGGTGSGFTGRTGDERVLGPVWEMRGRSPELALAVAAHLTRRGAEFDVEADRVRALVMLVGASCRVGRGFEVAAQGIRALRWAQALGLTELAHLARIDLAGCARALDTADSAAALLQPVLQADTAPSVRAAALVEASLCLARSGKQAELDYALAEADRLYGEDVDLDADSALLRRAQVRAAAAAQHRRRGDARTAAEASQEGQHLLVELRDRGVDDGSVRARLVMEHTLAMLDVGAMDEAVRGSAELIYQPFRAPAASSVNWLRFALASRVYLPARRLGRARELLLDACASAERHKLPLVLVGCYNSLAEVEELQGNHAEALHQVRSAQSARTELQRGAAQARQVLVEDFPPDDQQAASLIALLARAAAKPRVRADSSGASRDDRRGAVGAEDTDTGYRNGAVLQPGAPATNGGRRRKPEQDETPGAGHRAAAEQSDPTPMRGGSWRESAHQDDDWAGRLTGGGLTGGLAAGGLAGPGLAGLSAPEGSGGRRRAPESSGGGRRRAPEPDPADEPETTYGGVERDAHPRGSDYRGGADYRFGDDYWGGDDQHRPEVAPGADALSGPDADLLPDSSILASLAQEDRPSTPHDELGLDFPDWSWAAAEPKTTPGSTMPDDDVDPVGATADPLESADAAGGRVESGGYEQTKSEVARWLQALTGGGSVDPPATGPDERRYDREPRALRDTESRSVETSWTGAGRSWPDDGLDAPSLRSAAADAADRASRRNRRQRDTDEVDAPIPLRRSGRGRRDRSAERPEEPETATEYAEGSGEPDRAEKPADDLALGDLLTEAMMAYHNGTRPAEQDHAGRFAARADDPSTEEDGYGWPSTWPAQATGWPDADGGSERERGFAADRYSTSDRRAARLTGGSDTGSAAGRPDGYPADSYADESRPDSDPFRRTEFGGDGFPDAGFSSDPGFSSGTGFSNAGFPGDSHRDEREGGAHAGGLRPDTEWRFADRRYRSDRG